MKEKVLLNGNSMPVPAFGTAAIGEWQKDSDLVVDCVRKALEVGYRHIDTASIYGNERSVGTAVATSNVPRSEIFLTTKVWNSEQGYSETKAALERSLARLGVDYVDLYLIHWPNPANTDDTWRAMEELLEEGKVKNIGLSNFRKKDIDDLWEKANVKPVCNQIELHPYLQQKDFCAYLKEKDIAVIGWSPLGTGSWSGVRAEDKPLADPVVKEIAERKGVSAGQVILRWNLQHEFTPVPKSEKPERIAQNYELFNFELSDDEMKAIGELDRGARLGGDPEAIDAYDGMEVPD